MYWSKMGIVLGIIAAPWAVVSGQSGQELNATTFAQVQKQIKPQAGESRWLEVAWFLDLHAARQKAAAEGKPLFVYSAGHGTAIGGC